MRKLLAFLVISCSIAAAQNLSTAGNIKSSASGCALGSGSGYVWYQLPARTTSVGITISGTWAATVQFQGSVDGITWSSVTATPQPSGSGVTLTTANGIWSASATGLAYVCTYASAYTSGTAAVGMVATLSSGSGSGTVNTGATGQVAYYASDGTAVGGAPNFISNGSHQAMGVGAQIDTIPFVDGGAALNIQETSTSLSGDNGLVSIVTLNPTANLTSGSNFGIIGGMQSEVGNARVTGDLIGVYGEATHQGTAAIPQITGLNADTENLGGGSIGPPGQIGGMVGVVSYMDNASGHVYGPSTNPGAAAGMVGYYLDIFNESTADDVFGIKYGVLSNSGTITNLYGARLGWTNPTNTGSISNHYQLYLDAASLGSILNYQIYSAGTAPSFLAGPLQALKFQETLHTPASSSEACTAGQFTDDANFHYVCTATNIWKRAALSTF